MFIKLLFIFTIILIARLLYGQEDEEAYYSCKNFLGEDVDWFVELKLPGEGFLYYDNRMSSLGELNMEYHPDITDANTPHNRTLQQLFSRPRFTRSYDPLSLIFNDQPPKPRSSGKGHVKGAIAVLNQNGYFLSYSLPQFLNATNYEFPSNAFQKAQHIVCYSINRKSLNPLAEHLYIIHPNFYQLLNNEVRIPDSFKEDNDFLAKIGSNSFEKEKLKKNHAFQTTGDTEINIFSITNDLPDVLWDFVAETFEEDFTVISWYDKKTRCTKKHEEFAVHNVHHMQTVGLGKNNIKWVKANDHSKYGFSEKSKTVCFSDLNHTKLVAPRSGGAYCITDPNLYSAIKRSLRYSTKK